MIIKKTIFLLLIVLMTGTIVYAQSAGTIVFVTYDWINKIDPETGESPDMPHIYALEAAGYDVFPFYNASLSTAEVATLDTLYEANLIIMGRTTPSTGYGDHKQAWNDITTPTLCLEMWAIRNNRLNWLNTTAISSIAAEGTVTDAIIDVPDDPVFEGIDTSGPVPWIIGSYDAMGVTDAGYGTVLARMEADNNVLFVRWEPEVEFYDGSVDEPAGHRTLIGNGRDVSGVAPFDYYNFSEEAEKVFLAEVNRMVVLGGGAGAGGSAVEDKETAIPSTVELCQNYPNPFNPSTTIPFQLSQKSHVRLSLFNTNGKEVAIITNGEYSSGRHEVVFNADNLTTGIYIYKIETDTYSSVKKLTLMK